MENCEKYIFRNFTARRCTARFYADAFHDFGWELVGTESSFFTGETIMMSFRRKASRSKEAELSKLQREFEIRAGEVEALEESLERRAAVLSILIDTLGLFLFIFSLFFWSFGNREVSFPVLSLGFLSSILSLFVHTLVIDICGRKLEARVRMDFSRMYELKDKAARLKS